MMQRCMRLSPAALDARFDYSTPVGDTVATAATSGKRDLRGNLQNNWR
jgi:hypothetical protein